MRKMTHGSLFSGIGGFDLASEWAGWTNMFNCEIENFCKQILRYYWPDAKQYDDIRNTDFTVWRGKIDVLSGGFPCQPFSQAGKRKGTEDERHLWPEMLRAIREIQPRWIVGENVRGIINWSEGLVFEQVCADLEAEGYEVQSCLLPAAGIGAPHERYRTWFIAHRPDAGAENVQQGGGNSVLSAKTSAHADGNDARRCGYEEIRGAQRKGEGVEEKRQRVWGDIKRVGSEGTSADTYGEVPEWGDEQRAQRWSESAVGAQSFGRTGYWQDFPTQSPVCRRDDELSSRLDGITFSKWHRESVKGYGNAVVPQLVLQIFETINEHESL